ncbi:MAG: hypothetical protein ABIN80_06935 [Dyadobacter sp.]|uniref:hypothetical protein n=1 Tax=Dyadobacter sp. TaxID=1914288 RepID=UPI00326572D4
MKCFYTILFFAWIACAGANAQTVQKNDTQAYFSDFFIIEVKPMQFEVSYKYPKTDRVLVRIKDEEKNILFAEKTLVYKKYHKYFDLSTMKDGIYTFELTDGEHKFSQSFTVATKTLRVATAL